MPVSTDNRKTKTHRVIVGTAEVTLDLSDDIRSEDLQEITRALRDVAVLNALMPPISNVPGGTPQESSGQYRSGSGRARMTDAMWEGEDGPVRNVAAEDDSDPEPNEAPEPPKSEVDFEVLMEAAKNLGSEFAKAIGLTIKKALEDL